MLQHIRFAVRTLLKSPGFTVVAVLTLACGVGANTAIFTLINALFLRPLAVTEPSRLLSLNTSDPRNPGDLPMSRPNYDDYRDRNQVFSGLMASTFSLVAMATGGDPEQIAIEMVTSNYFDVLGVAPTLGRGFRPEEDGQPDAHPVVVISHALWKRRFGARPEVLSETINLNGHALQIIGVAPRDFKGTNVFGPALWAPLAMYRQLYLKPELYSNRRFLWLNAVGRLKPGVSAAQAQAAISTLASQLEMAYPSDNKQRTIKLAPLTQNVLGPGNRPVMLRAGWILMIIVGLVLLIACANVANLLLVRAASRRKEMAIRLSMGAGRGRILAQLMIESLLLASAGGALGLLLAFWLRDLMWWSRPPLFRNADLDLSLDSRVLLFTLGICLATGLLFGLAPALESARADLANELRERSQSGKAGLFQLRNILVAAQMALSTIALVAAGLFLRSLQNTQQIDPGFDADRLAVMTVNPGGQGYMPARAQELYRHLAERLRTTPGVAGASMSSVMPMGFPGFQRSVFPEGGEVTPDGRGILVVANVIGPRYFETMGIPLLSGRDFRESDREDSTPVAIINQTMAKRFWADQNPVGKRFRFFTDTFMTEVVGVARDSKFFNLGEKPVMCAYSPELQQYAPSINLLVRAQGDPAAVLPSVRREIQTIDPQLLLTNVATVKDMMQISLWAPRLAAGLLGIFGLLALALASIGIYGVMAYAVSQRTREIGIRMALGAERSDVTGMVVRQGMLLVGAGVAVGLLFAAAVTRFAISVLYGVSAIEPATFGAVTVLLLAAALLACYIPSRRAARVDPVIALRWE